MADAFFKPPVALNESVLSYAPGSPERDQVKLMLDKILNQKEDLPMYIGGKAVRTGNMVAILQPHDHKHTLGVFHKGDSSHVQTAIEAAMRAKKDWEAMAWQDRAAIFLKAADLLAGPYRQKMNAATMLCQSKNIYQSEIDSVAELCDFLRFNVQYMTEIFAHQPENAKGTWNRMDYRPLEGFVFAITPFNFTSIAGNLPSAPALLGNTVVWKPAETQVFSAHVIMEVLEAAGLPAGVVNLIFVDGPAAGDIIFQHPDFSGLHFTGSTGVFQHLWATIGKNIGKYKTYPRIVGETGGKDFVVAHPSADPMEVAVALARGAFEYQGQKCSAASRAYLPKSLWSKIKEKLGDDLSTFKMGSPVDFSNFINAVIDERSFDKISNYIAQAKKDSGVETLFGGTYDKSTGYFISPTVILASDPHYRTMCEEIFGPVLTIFLYEDNAFEETLDIVNTTSSYALTGSIFARDRQAIVIAAEKLRHAAGNFYINDKPTGAVVGQQPFGGARGSGTNDKAGSILNLFRWLSPRTIKENFVPPVDYRYPFLNDR